MKTRDGVVGFIAKVDGRNVLIDVTDEPYHSIQVVGADAAPVLEMLGKKPRNRHIHHVYIDHIEGY